MVLKIGINGFGRIGRLVLRAAKMDPAVQALHSHLSPICLGRK